MTVSFGEPTKPAAGGASATLEPSTPNRAHAKRARVGPKSAPPCLVLPPTKVGASPIAFWLHADAPSQPRLAISA